LGSGLFGFSFSALSASFSASTSLYCLKSSFALSMSAAETNVKTVRAVKITFFKTGSPERVLFLFYHFLKFVFGFVLFFPFDLPRFSTSL
jgi:hypothetical protein